MLLNHHNQQPKNSFKSPDFTASITLSATDKTVLLINPTDNVFSSSVHTSISYQEFSFVAMNVNNAMAQPSSTTL